jgi:sugar transferase (PEP-CTERM system associated)
MGVEAKADPPMIRIFNHYFSLSALRALGFDLGLVLVLVMLAVGMNAGGLAQAIPVAGSHLVSFAACLVLVGSASGLYESSSRGSAARSAARAAFVLLVLLPLAHVIFGLLPDDLGNLRTIQVSVMAGVAALVVRRAYLSHAHSHAHPHAHAHAAAPARARILIFGAGTAARDVSETLSKNDPNADIVGFVPGPNEREAAVPAHRILPLDDTLPALARRHSVDEIVVALTERRSGSMPLRQLLDCKVAGVKVHDLNTHFEKTLGQIRIDYLNASWLIFGDGFNQGLWRTGVKRVFDLFCATILLVLSLPVMLVTAVLIKLESPGPVLYRQERTGLHGRSFSIAKFRSMRNDAEKDGKPVWAAANDARVTRVGAVIRRLRIDELPQLFNVLLGEMSLVGPRPERPYFVDQLTQEIPFYALRHSVKPGVTGWAQVRYPYGATVEDSQEKLQFDLYYVKNHTLFLDLLVLMETVGVVLTGKGAR